MEIVVYIYMYILCVCSLLKTLSNPSQNRLFLNKFIIFNFFASLLLWAVHIDGRNNKMIIVHDVYSKIHVDRMAPKRLFTCAILTYTHICLLTSNEQQWAHSFRIYISRLVYFHPLHDYSILYSLICLLKVLPWFVQSSLCSSYLVTKYGLIVAIIAVLHRKQRTIDEIFTTYIPF